MTTLPTTTTPFASFAPCPRAHAWCDGHQPGVADTWHRRADTVTTSFDAFPILFILDEESADPTIQFEIDEWLIPFADMAQEVAHLHEFADAIAARLTWFTIGVEALKPFEGSVYPEGEGAPPEFHWEMPCAGTDYEHIIVYDAELGWRMMPVTGIDALPSAVAGVWLAEVERLGVAFEFLRETFVPREQP